MPKAKQNQQEVELTDEEKIVEGTRMLNEMRDAINNNNEEQQNMKSVLDLFKGSNTQIIGVNDSMTLNMSTNGTISAPKNTQPAIPVVKQQELDYAQPLPNTMNYTGHKIMNKMDKYEMVIKSGQAVLFLEGKPGTAKSAIIKAIADKNGWQFIDVRASMKDSAEIGGYPIPTINDEVAEMHYAIPEWAIRANRCPTLIFFDEIDRAMKDTQNALFQILLDRKIGEKFIFNDNVFFACAGNGDSCGLDELDPALYNRLFTVKHDLNFIEWKDMYAEQNIIPEILGFLTANPEWLWKKAKDTDKNYATPRSWTFISNFVKRLGGDVKDAIEVFGSGYVGIDASSKLLRWIIENEKVTFQDVLDRYSKVKPIIDKADRSKKSELITQLIEEDMNVFSDKQLSNMIKFFKTCDKDEVCGALKTITIMMRDGKLKDKYVNQDKGDYHKWIKSKNFQTFCDAFKTELDIMKAERVKMVGGN